MIIAAVIVAALLVTALYLFQPWRLFFDSTLTEDLPSANTSQSEKPASPMVSPTESATEAPKDVVLSTGQLISHEHETTGTVSIIALASGERVLRLENLVTTNGPDLKVWLSDAPVIGGTDGWYVFDDGGYVDLGALEANLGSHNYEIPADVQLNNFTSVSIWCARFAVSFGAAELATPTIP